MIILIVIGLFAAIVNGALGYGFSSLVVPNALLFYTNKEIAPALVLMELVVNAFIVIMNRRSLTNVWRRVVPIVAGLVPGILIGSYALYAVDSGWLKFFTYVVILPLILFQAAGFRRPIIAERKVWFPLGVGIGLLYSTTTISGPPLAMMFNNQGLKKEDFKAALGLVRVAETTMTAIAYFFLRLYIPSNATMLSYLVPGVIVGLPLGAYVIRHLNAETFRRICMSFDAWVVGFGLSRTVIDLKVLTSPAGYAILFAVVIIDAYLLYQYFVVRRGKK